MLSEFQKMVAGQLYNSADPNLCKRRNHARRLTREFNGTSEVDLSTRLKLLTELFGKVGAGIFIEPPFHCDYGSNIFAGEALFMNFGCVILDCAEVRIGDRVLCGPGVQIYTATHPLEAALRASGMEFAKPVAIGDQVWLGGGSIVCPGVTIGENTVIGAGAVVTKSIPANVFAAGNPCRVLRSLESSV
jgi:maltose O-acetyltransferase